MEQLKQEIRDKVQAHADKAGYTLNPDKESLNFIIDGLANNTIKFGACYCPCRMFTGNVKEDKKIICPCIYHKKEIEKEGACHCDLFFKPN